MLSILRFISIEPVVFFYVLAIFAEYDVVGDLFYVSKCIDHLKLNATDQLHLCTEDLKHNKSSEISNAVSKEANDAQKIYNGILYATSIISSFIAATYADRQSKFWPIIIPIIGSAIVQLFVLGSLFNNFSDEIPFLFQSNGSFIIFICSCISGITGGTSTLLASCFAHVAEKCPQSQRTSRITIVEACLFGGGFFGFTFAGAILRRYPNSLNRYNLNFGLFLTAHLLMLFYVIIRRRMFSKPNQTQSSQVSYAMLFTSVFRTITRQRVYRYQRRVICLILLAYIVISYWTVAITTMLFIYTRNLLQWPSWKYSYFSSAKFGLCGIFLCLLPIVQYLLGIGKLAIGSYFQKPLNDGTLITIGLLSRTLTIVLIGLSSVASNDLFMILALVSIIFAEYPIPAIRSMITKIVEPNEKAQMFAVLAAIQSICFFTGGIGFLAIYNAVLGQIFSGPGWIFIIVGFLQLLSMFIFWYIEYLLYQSNAEQMSITSRMPNTNISELEQNE
ncbi:hypothetical protein DERF_011132 [Dermatophagoides farinae]|uniref:Uncharacterized protein n=1 Tax=Dermatophagoides farinae TaxID=6954 RepID=A0A922L4H5_DERFA|nr:solute carrier family 46 member 3-like [Dermatophagoides farinae]KAH7643550.1 hypothetical protein HUG17_5912 [Dermatophagoides farinae]KAH9506394.1 hypothetical protein DERF_011132 [Dermatophagoides farinae]